MRTLRRPLLLTGGPAVGKSVTARSLAQGRHRCAVVEVDDIRQLVVAGGVAPWLGEEGARQQRRGVLNACALARNFLTDGIEVVLTDVVTPATCALYREELPSVLVVHLQITKVEAQRRASTRPAWLTDDEFDLLHQADVSNPPAADASLPVEEMNASQQVAATDALWASAAQE